MLSVVLLRSDQKKKKKNQKLRCILAWTEGCGLAGVHSVNKSGIQWAYQSEDHFPCNYLSLQSPRSDDHMAGPKEVHQHLCPEPEPAEPRLCPLPTFTAIPGPADCAEPGTLTTRLGTSHHSQR